MGRLALAILLLMLLPTSGRGDDISDGVPLPGPKSVPARSISITSTSIVLQADKVEARFAFSARNASPVKLVIEGPRFGWRGEGEPYPDRQFPELSIFLDGAPANLTDSFVVFYGPNDITQLVRQAGLDPFAIAETPPFVKARAGAEDILRQLEKQGAIEKSDDGLVAKWTAQRELTIPLRNGTRGTLVLRYDARPAYQLLPFSTTETSPRLADFCLSPQELKAALGNPEPSRSFTIWRYDIPAAIDHLPSRALSVEIGAPPKTQGTRRFVAFCGRNGNPVLGSAANLKADAKTDGGGALHILSVSDPIKLH